MIIQAKLVSVHLSSKPKRPRVSPELIALLKGIENKKRESKAPLRFSEYHYEFQSYKTIKGWLDYWVNHEIGSPQHDFIVMLSNEVSLEAPFSLTLGQQKLWAQEFMERHFYNIDNGKRCGLVAALRCIEDKLVELVQEGTFTPKIKRYFGKMKKRVTANRIRVLSEGL